MMKFAKILGVSALSASVLMACSSPEEEEPTTSPEEGQVEEEVSEETTKTQAIDEEVVSAIRSSLEKNMSYAQSEDMEAYLNSMALDEEVLQSTREETQLLFDNLDLEYELLELNVVSVDDGIAVANIKQKAVATFIKEGWGFKDYTADVTHTLVEEDDEWKIQKTEVHEFETDDAENQTTEDPREETNNR